MMAAYVPRVHALSPVCTYFSHSPWVATQHKDTTRVSRSEVYGSTKAQFASRSREQLRQPWRVRVPYRWLCVGCWLSGWRWLVITLVPRQVEFEGETAIDVGGVKRELVTLVSRAMTQPSRRLFRCDPQMRFFPECVDC